MATSPVIKKKNKEENTQHLMTFSDALVLVIAGKKITRLGWEKKGSYVFLKDGWLCIHHAPDPKEKYHTLLVSEGDLVGNDWVVLDDGDTETKN